MGAAAELQAPAAHIHHTHDLAVLLAEQGRGMGFLGLFEAHFLRDDRVIGKDRTVHRLTHRIQLFRRGGGEVGKVKAEQIRIHEGAGLMHMLTKNLAQGFMQQVGRAVGAAEGRAAVRISRHRNGVPDHGLSGPDDAAVHELSALVLLDALNLKDKAVLADDAGVGELAAHLGIEDAAVQNEDGLIAFGDKAAGLALTDGREKGRLAAVLVVADKLRIRNILAEADAGPAEIAQRLAGLTGTHALLLHQAAEAFLVHGVSGIPAHLDGEVEGETVGVVELERVRAGEHRLALGAMALQKLGEDAQARVDGSAELLFLAADDGRDVLLLFLQLGILAAADFDDGVDDFTEEGLVHAEELAVAGSPAQQAAQHVAAAFVGRKHAVADHENGAADVVRDNAQGNVLLMALAVVGAGEFADLMGDVHDGVHVEERVDALADHREALQTHSGVDVLLLEFGVVVVAVVVKLTEHIVPDLDVAVAVAAHRAGRLAAAVLLAAVIVDLRAGAAGAGAVLPEVVLLAEAEDALGRDADVVLPDGGGFIVVHIDRRVQAVRIQAHPLRGSQEFPAPGDGFLLEIITEGEVAQHLKEGAVTGRLADVFDVAGADALLAGADPVPRRLLFSLEPGLHRRHAGVDEQQARVILGNQREARQAQVALGFKEAEKHLSQFVQSVVFHVFSSFSVKDCLI